MCIINFILLSLVKNGSDSSISTSVAMLHKLLRRRVTVLFYTFLGNREEGSLHLVIEIHTTLLLYHVFYDTS